MIYIIYGASGSGKTTLLLAVRERFGEKAINKKGTDRPKRSYDDIEVISYDSGIPKDKYDYFYSQYGHEYAIDKNQLEDAIKNGYEHFVICNDIETIKKIKSDFKFNVKVIYLHFDAPEASIREIQKRRGIKDDEINLRISKIQYLREQYFENLSMFDEIINNKYGENPETYLWPQMERIIGNVPNIPSFEIIQQTIDYLVEVTKRQEVKTEPTYDKSLIEKGYVFIIMAMGIEDETGQINNEKALELQGIQATIKAVASDCGMRAGIANNFSDNEMIITKIVENIKKAELIIADLSYERPNCYFELGYAMALKKDIIIIAKEETTIHFDVQGYEVINYKDIIELERELKGFFLKRKIN